MDDHTFDLFESPPPQAVAEHRATTGIRRAGKRAESSITGWIQTAATAIRRYAENHGEFLVEQVIKAYPEIPEPPDGRAWGAATRLAVRRGWIRKVGYAPANSSNRSPKCLWLGVPECVRRVTR